MFKSAVLKRVHINQVSSSNNKTNSGNMNEKKNVAKGKKKNQCGQRHRVEENDSLDLDFSLSDRARSSRDTGLNERAASDRTRTRCMEKLTESIPSSIDRRRLSNIFVKERKKDPRLNGADLYVARIGRNTASTTTELRTTVISQASESHAATKTRSGFSENAPHTGSLFDELTIASTPEVATTARSRDNNGTCDVAASRPCYRCIQYMHNVGIKRVFWTNEQGQWEGSKVRDLVAAIDDAGEDGAMNGKLGGPTGDGLFVTKHEVLMLRRLLDNRVKS